MKKKILCLMLAVFMMTGCFVACDDADDDIDGGELTDGNWESLDFKDATLTVSVSANADEEVTFSAADKYTKGPDKPSQEEVQKKVLIRNKKVADDLNINLVYQTTDLWYSEILAHVEQLVSNDAADAPDVYNNDIYALTSAMLNGYLWNVSDPGLDAKGREVTSYFDFDHDCWYKEYMEGTSFSKDKLYMLVGDYNIDIIRFAWVFFVNINLFDATFGSLSADDGWSFNTYESLCDFIVDTGDWFYDDMIALAEMAHNDAGGSTQGKTDKNDAQIGVCMNSLAQRVMIWGSGVSVYEWSKNGKACDPGEGTPSLIAENDIEAMVQLGNKYTKLYNAKGVFAGVAVKDSTTLFMDGKIVMSMAELGEMESEAMRGTSFKRGILPFPCYDRAYTESVTTVVHDQAEIDTILNNAKSFNMASAFLQYVNELSTEILDIYYEEVLKFKYNDSKGARAMIDLVHDTIDSPFDSVLSAKVFSEKQFYVSFQSDATANRDSTFSSTYAESREAVQKTLEEMLESFDKLQ